MAVEVVSQQPDQITLQVTINLNGSMLEMEQSILDANNALGRRATEEAIKRFDTDGSPIIVGDTKLTSQSKNIRLIKHHMVQSKLNDTCTKQ